MKLTVLSDNNTLVGKYLEGEPGACYYIEDGDSRILLDTGFSDLFLRNAARLGVDVSKVTAIAISHGHDDHVMGLPFLAQRMNLSKVKVFAHPYAFCPKRVDGQSNGTIISQEAVEGLCSLTLTKEPCKISENIWFLGEIPRFFDFENKKPTGEFCCGGVWQEDFLLDDTALAYQTERGFYIITGCSHSGICNITEHAKAVCGQQKVLGIIGGLHMFHHGERLNRTVEYLKAQGEMEFWPCHCVSFEAKAAMNASIPVREVGAGLQIEW